MEHVKVDIDNEQYTSTLHKIKNKNLTLEDFSLILPEGHEYLFLLLHILLAPYITGLIFIFLFITEANLTLFTSMLDDLSFFLTWCIGYELLIFIFLIGLIAKGITIMHPKKEIILKF